MTPNPRTRPKIVLIFLKIAIRASLLYMNLRISDPIILVIPVKHPKRMIATIINTALANKIKYIPITIQAINELLLS